MLGLRTQRITFGCPAGNIAGGLLYKAYSMVKGGILIVKNSPL
nr:MAG TPA: hypothetical protein [Caudoviricetes sp.]